MKTSEKTILTLENLNYKIGDSFLVGNSSIGIVLKDEYQLQEVQKLMFELGFYGKNKTISFHCGYIEERTDSPYKGKYKAYFDIIN